MPHLLAAELTLVQGPAECRRDTPMRFRISAKNTGQSVWLNRRHAPDGKGAVRVGVHLLDERGEEIVHDYGGVSIGEQVEPGGRVVMDLVLPAPPSAGNYQLEFDMVSEYVTWFEDAGSTIPLVHSIKVQ